MKRKALSIATMIARHAATAVIVGSLLATTSTASAADPAACLPWRFFKKTAAPTSPACACPNDYCPKSQPTVCNECRGTCDDYCPKPEPCVRPDKRGCCDDYRPKPWQPLSWCPPCVYRCLPGGCPAR
jgi:hypothetical protein